MIQIKNRRKTMSAQSGFTLLELLISLVVGIVILIAISSTFLIQRDEFDAESQVVEAVQTARAALDMMTREIRMGGYNPTGADFNGLSYDPSQLCILSDLDGDGVTDGTNEDIVYRYYGDTKQIKRKADGGNFEPFAENITEMTFEYLNGKGNVTTISEDIRQIQLTITAITAEPVADSGYRTVTLTNRVMARNLAFGR